MQITIGCDPELFVFDKEKDRIVPAVGLVEGTKSSPHRLTDGTVQLDGTVVEIGTDPASSGEEWVEKLISVVGEVREMLGDRYELRCGAIAAYEPEDCQFSNTHFDSGCDAQYTFDRRGRLLRVNSSPYDHTAVPTGGHIHVGFGCDLPITDPVLLKSAHQFTSHTPRPVINAHDLKRANMMAAVTQRIVRVKSYGVELRNPSAYWLGDKDCALAWHSRLQNIADHLSRGTRINRSPIYAPIRGRIRALESKYQGTLPVDF